MTVSVWEYPEMTSLNKHYPAGDIEARILDALRSAGLDPDRRLTPDQLGALDHFLAGGYQASPAAQNTTGKSRIRIFMSRCAPNQDIHPTTLIGTDFS